MTRHHFGAGQLVLSRALCRFARFDLSRLPANKRRAALSLQLPHWSPYRESDYAVAWDAGVAYVWCWDRTVVEAALQVAGRAAKGLRKIPETLLREPQADGPRLLACLDGFEGQCWQASRLTASRWWPKVPAAQEWISFLRDCSLNPEQQQVDPQPQNIDFGRRPWAAISKSHADAGDLALAELSAYASLILMLGLATLVLGIDQYRLGLAIDIRKTEIAQAEEQSRPLLDARNTALAAMQKVQMLNGLQRFPPPLMLMVGVARVLPEGGAFLKEWEMSDGKLKILVSSPSSEISGATYVTALEKSRLFAEVKIITQTDPKQMGFAMTIRSQDSIGLDVTKNLTQRLQ